MVSAALYAPTFVSGRRAHTVIRLRRAVGRTLITVARSVAVFVPVFLVATFVTFALRSISGLSPARIQLGEEATPAAVHRIQAQWGLDRPFLAQYWTWFDNVLHANLGR
ncbi:MAG TPA: hypothetical protein VK816_06180, partial [Jatrophihabitantaceae bacterium]|nr:hypothetical protein [Jatrophihabitantaceae bacterium]